MAFCEWMVVELQCLAHLSSSCSAVAAVVRDHGLSLLLNTQPSLSVSLCPFCLSLFLFLFLVHFRHTLPFFFSVPLCLSLLLSLSLSLFLSHSLSQSRDYIAQHIWRELCCKHVLQAHNINLLVSRVWQRLLHHRLSPS